MTEGSEKGAEGCLPPGLAVRLSDAPCLIFSIVGVAVSFDRSLARKGVWSGQGVPIPVWYQHLPRYNIIMITISENSMISRRYITPLLALDYIKQINTELQLSKWYYSSQNGIGIV